MFIDNLIHEAMYKKDNKLVDDLRNAVRFQVDNVARYMYGIREERGVIDGEKGKRFKFDMRKEIPNIAPLATVMWFEFNGSSAGQPSSEDYGCLLSVDYDPVAKISSKRFGENLALKDIRWVLRADFYGKDRFLHEWNESRYTYLISIDKDGQFINDARFLRGHEGSSFELEGICDEEVLIALTAICFAHCKGASTKEHQPSRQVRRHAERKNEPVYSYQTIDIGPASRVLSGEGNISQNGLGKALHICRGHFAHYTADKPLFGKYVGTVYKPMHLRGKADIGVVDKDYRVHAETKP